MGRASGAAALGARLSPPGDRNVLLDGRATGLRRRSVANVSRVLTLDKTDLTERTGHLPPAKLDLVLAGIDVVFGMSEA